MTFESAVAANNNRNRCPFKISYFPSLRTGMAVDVGTDIRVREQEYPSVSRIVTSYTNRGGLETEQREVCPTVMRIEESGLSQVASNIHTST